MSATSGGSFMSDGRINSGDMTNTFTVSHIRLLLKATDARFFSGSLCVFQKRTIGRYAAPNICYFNSCLLKLTSPFMYSNRLPEDTSSAANGSFSGLSCFAPFVSRNRERFCYTAVCMTFVNYLHVYKLLTSLEIAHYDIDREMKRPTCVLNQHVSESHVWGKSTPDIYKLNFSLLVFQNDELSPTMKSKTS